MPADAPVPLHDWTRVSAGRWHDMHLAWTAALRTELNSGLLPDPFFALAEPATGFQIGGGDGDDIDFGDDEPPFERREPDMLAAVGRETFAARAGSNGSAAPHFDRPDRGVALAEAPALVRTVEELGPPGVRRRITVRHPDGDRVVAVVEFASPGNRDAVSKVARFSETLAAALEAGIHAVLIDPFPPTGPAPDGLHGAVVAQFGASHRLDPDHPLTFAGYRAISAPGVSPTAFVQTCAAGEPPPTVPLFLDPAWCLPLDLAPGYAAAFRGCPKPVRDRLSAAA